MSRYDSWSKEDLVWKCRELEREIENLETRVRELKSENDHLEFRIRNELEPRIQAERRSYDMWVSDPER